MLSGIPGNASGGIQLFHRLPQGVRREQERARLRIHLHMTAHIPKLILNDESSLSGIKNLKGEETYSTDGNKLTWETDGKDIYYQGTTEQALPVSMKFTYYLDGQEMKPEDLKGKSGHLTIHIDYRNNTKKTVDINGKAEEMYSPFVMIDRIDPAQRDIFQCSDRQRESDLRWK